MLRFRVIGKYIKRLCFENEVKQLSLSVLNKIHKMFEKMQRIEASEHKIYSNRLKQARIHRKLRIFWLKQIFA